MSEPSNPPTPAITKDLLRELGDWRADKEGRQLAESGAVQHLQFTAPVLSGVVRGTGGATINARLKIGAGQFDVENLCSCRQAREHGTICAHVVALVYAWLNKDAPPKPMPPVEPIPSQTVPRFQRVALTEALPGSAALELEVLLPVDFAAAWRRGELRIILEGALDGGPLRPLATIQSQPDAPYAVSDADERLLNVVENLNSGQVPGIWILAAKAFDEFFTVLADHPRVLLGKRSVVSVRSAADRPRVFLDVQPGGEMKLRLDEAKPRSGETLGGWSFDGAVLERVNPLPSAYQGLTRGEVTLSRAELAKFWERELPGLEQHAELVGNEAFGRLEFAVVTPRIRATVDGTLAGLSVQLTAIYGEQSFALHVPTNPDWVPDPTQPLRYWKRDAAAEDRARRAVVAAGFTPDQRWPELFMLRGDNRAGAVLANVLPQWRARWEVVCGARLTAVLAQCEILTPEISFRSSGENWLAVDVAFKNGRGESPLTPAAVQQLLQKGMAHQRLANGRVALVPTEAAQEFQEVIYDCAARQTDAGMLIDRRFGSYLGEAARDGGWNIAARSDWQPPATITALREVALPAGLGERLRDYQRDGVNWLQHLGQNGMAGILADEMGLGKTIQALAYLAAQPGAKPSLVVCPTSLVTNWQAEAARFTPSLKTLLLHGPKRQGLFAEIPMHNLVITSYALLRRDVAAYAGVEFDTVILDEAQQIKNRFSQNAQAVKALRAGRRFVLTGTPMENALTDLWSIFDFLMPGYLGPAKEFQERYETPITKTNDAAALRRLRQRFRPFVLRRTKAEVAQELPAKIEQVALCEMSDEQQSVYQAILDQGRREVFEHAGKGGASRQRMAVLTTLTRLRQACCHLELLPRVAEQPWREPSAKLDLCLELIDEAMSGGHRVLVFSQFVRMLQLLVAAFREREIAHCYLDGATVDRQGEVRRFQETPTIPVFLISLKAGGTGLNLTGADTVIHFDPWWNPAVENQATARVHRIGQSNIVTAYKLIASGTVEEKIVKLQEKKKQLTAGILATDEAFIQSLTWAELQGLLE